MKHFENMKIGTFLVTLVAGALVGLLGGKYLHNDCCNSDCRTKPDLPVTHKPSANGLHFSSSLGERARLHRRNDPAFCDGVPFFFTALDNKRINSFFPYYGLAISGAIEHARVVAHDA
jgi:hypothetical protein